MGSYSNQHTRRSFGSGGHGYSDEEGSIAQALQSQKREYSRLSWQAEQAAGRGYISMDDLAAAKNTNDSNIIQRLLGQGIAENHNTGGALETIGDVLNLPVELMASISQATLESGYDVPLPDSDYLPDTLKIGFSPSAFAKAWQHKTTYSKIIDSRDVFSSEGGKIAGGFVTDVLMDPTTYLTFGVKQGMKVSTGVAAKAAPVAEKALAKGASQLTLTRFGSTIYRRAASKFAPLLRQEMLDAGEVAGENLLSQPLARQWQERIMQYAVENFDDLKKAHVKELTEGWWGKASIAVNPAGERAQAALRSGADRVAKALGSKKDSLMGYGVEDLFQETASTLGKERVAYDLTKQQYRLGKTTLGKKFLDTFDKGWNVPDEVLETARLGAIASQAAYDKAISHYTSNLKLSEDELDTVSRLVEARGQMMDYGAAGLIPFGPFEKHIEDAATFVSSEMQKILGEEQAFGVAIDSVDGYISHIPNAEVRTFYREALRHNGQESINAASRWTQARLIGSIAEGEELFGEGSLTTNALEILAKRKRASIQMMQQDKLFKDIIEKESLPAAIMHQLGHGNLPKGILRGWARRAGFGVHKISQVDQVYTTVGGHLHDLGFKWDTEAPIESFDRNLEVLRYLMRSQDDVERTGVGELSGRYSATGEAEAARLGVPEEAKLHFVEYGNGDIRIRKPLPRQFRYRSGPKLGKDVRQGIVQGGKRTFAKGSPTFDVDKAFQMLSNPEHPMWDNLLSDSVGGTKLNPDRVFGFLDGLDSYTKRFLDSSLTGMVPDLEERVLAAVERRLTEQEGKLGNWMDETFGGGVHNLGRDTTVSGLLSDLKRANTYVSKEQALILKRFSSNPDIANVPIRITHQGVPRGFGAVYDPATHSIIVRPGQSVATIVHEATHAAVSNYMLLAENVEQGVAKLQGLEGLNLTWGQQDFRQSEAYKAWQALPTDVHRAVRTINALYDVTKRHINNAVEIGTKAERVAAAELSQYGFTNVHEFVAEAFSNPKFRELLDTIKVNVDNHYGDYATDVAHELDQLDSTPDGEIFGGLGSTSVRSRETLVNVKVPLTEKELAKRSAVVKSSSGLGEILAGSRPEEKTVYKTVSLWSRFVSAISKLLGFEDDTVTAHLFAQADRLVGQTSSRKALGEIPEINIKQYAKASPLDDFKEKLASTMATYNQPFEFRKVIPQVPETLVALARATRRNAGIMTDTTPVTAVVERDLRSLYAKLGFTPKLTRDLSKLLFDKEAPTTLAEADRIIETLRPFATDAPYGSQEALRQLPGRLGEKVVAYTIKVTRKVTGNAWPEEFDQSVAIGAQGGKVSSASGAGEALAMDEGTGIVDAYGTPSTRVPEHVPDSQAGKLAEATYEDARSVHEGKQAKWRILNDKLDALVPKEKQSRITDINIELASKKQARQAAKTDKERKALAKEMTKLRKELNSIPNVKEYKALAKSELKTARKEMKEAGDAFKAAKREYEAYKASKARSTITGTGGLVQGDLKKVSRGTTSDEIMKLRRQLVAAQNGRSKADPEAIKAKLTELTKRLTSGDLGKATPNFSREPAEYQVYLPEGIANYLNELNAPNIDPTLSDFAKKTVRLFDRIQGFYKTNLLLPFGAYHARNMMQAATVNVMRYGLGLLSPKDNFRRGTDYMHVLLYALGRNTDLFSVLGETRMGKISDALEAWGSHEIKAGNGATLTVKELVDEALHRGILHGAAMSEMPGDVGLWSRAASAVSGGGFGGMVGGLAGGIADTASGNQDGTGLTYGSLLGVVGGAVLGGRRLGRAGTGEGIPHMIADQATTLVQSRWAPFMRVGEAATELPFRLGMFMGGVSEHGSVVDAAKEVYQHMNDYHGLSVFERRWLRRLIPFYSWTKTAIKSSALQAIERPGSLAGLFKASRAWNTNYDGDPEDQPDYLHDKLTFLTQQTGPDGKLHTRIGVPSVTAIEDVASMASAFNVLPAFTRSSTFQQEMSEMFTGIGSRASFPLVTLMEAVTGKDSFTGKSLDSVNADQWASAPGWLQGLVSYQPAQAGKTRASVNPTMTWVLGEIPVSRFVQFMRQIESADAVTKGQLDSWALAKNFLGASTVKVDPKTQRYFVNKGRITALKNLLDNVLTRQLGTPPTSARRPKMRYFRR